MPSCPLCRTQYPEGAAHCPEDGTALVDDAAFRNLDRELAPGDVIGEYRIEGKIGEGGFGAVYAAVHPLIGKRAALKTLHREHSTNPQIVARFIAEAKAVNQIRHRNIIDIFSFGNLPDGRHYFLMELLEGQTFEEFFRGRGRLTLPEALPVLRGVARALDAAHAKGIAHRDLKPENVYLVTEDDGSVTPKLLDFGVAKLSSPEEGGAKTRTGAPIGTPYYMSPEQARGVNVDFRTDIYALGVMSFQVLTGHVPFNGASLMDVLMAHISAPPPRPSEREPAVPQALDEPVVHMLAKDPAQRPRSAGAAVDELEAVGRSAGLLPMLPSTTPAHASGENAPRIGRSGEERIAHARPHESVPQPLNVSIREAAGLPVATVSWGKVMAGLALSLGVGAAAFVALSPHGRTLGEAAPTASLAPAKGPTIPAETAPVASGASTALEITSATEASPLAPSASVLRPDVPSAKPVTVETLKKKPTPARAPISRELADPFAR